MDRLTTTTTTTETERKQYVWFVRYGLTEHPLVEDLGPYDSDIDPSEGIEHAIAIAKRIAAGLRKNNNDDSETTDESIPTVVYSSPFLRTSHTGYTVANELQQQQQKQQTTTTGDVELRVEEGLWEWLIPSLLVTVSDGIKTNPRPIETLREDLLKLEEGRAPTTRTPATIAVGYQSVNPYDDSGDGEIVSSPELLKKESGAAASTPAEGGGGGRPPRWTESEEDLIARCETTLSRLLANHNETGNSICIVSHAPCDQAMAFNGREIVESPRDSELMAPWPLGGITVFSRPIGSSGGDGTSFCRDNDNGARSIELYGDTEHMPGDYKKGLKEWSLPCFTK